MAPTLRPRNVETTNEPTAEEQREFILNVLRESEKNEKIVNLDCDYAPDYDPTNGKPAGKKARNKPKTGPAKNKAPNKPKARSAEEKASTELEAEEETDSDLSSTHTEVDIPRPVKKPPPVKKTFPVNPSPFNPPPGNPSPFNPPPGNPPPVNPFPVKKPPPVKKSIAVKNKLPDKKSNIAAPDPPSEPEEDMPKNKKRKKPINEEEILELLNAAPAAIKQSVFKRLKSDHDVIEMGVQEKKDKSPKKANESKLSHEKKGSNDLAESEDSKKADKLKSSNGAKVDPNLDEVKNANDTPKSPGKQKIQLSEEFVDIEIPQTREERYKFAEKLNLDKLTDGKVRALIKCYSQTGNVASDTLRVASSWVQEAFERLQPLSLVKFLISFLKGFDDNKATTLVDLSGQKRGVRAVRNIHQGEQVIASGVLRLLYGYYELHLEVEARLEEEKENNKLNKVQKSVGQQDAILKSKIYHKIIEEDIGEVAKAGLTKEELSTLIGKMQTAKGIGARLAVFTNRFGIGFLFALAYSNVVRGGYDISKWNAGLAPSFVRILQEGDNYHKLSKISSIAGEFLVDLLNNQITGYECIPALQEVAKELSGVSIHQVGKIIEIESSDDDTDDHGEDEINIIVNSFPKDKFFVTYRGKYAVTVNSRTLGCFRLNRWLTDDAILASLICYGKNLFDNNVLIVDPIACFSTVPLQNKIDEEINTILFPVNISHQHWVAVAAVKNEKSHWTITYMDSLFSKNNYKEAKRQVDSYIAQNTNSSGKNTWCKKEVAKQIGTSDCGVLAISNLISFLNEHAFVKTHNAVVGKLLRKTYLQLVLEEREAAMKIEDRVRGAAMKIEDRARGSDEQDSEKDESEGGEEATEGGEEVTEGGEEATEGGEEATEGGEEGEKEAGGDKKEADAWISDYIIKEKMEDVVYNSPEVRFERNSPDRFSRHRDEGWINGNI
ncbi:hypothetical protein BGAL_0814g00010 [Botrytis galanthina]|uniref:Ubiquitin-like protease family profile domain-containing protein n=1 Tax=Botrytis galanthina TaxID=278940 RepID=A0A4S8QHD4_9HELO|nr:hypothetical protein BGAL_0814g00010 [Botrytis galanthina]